MPLTTQNLAFLQSLADAGAKPFHTMEPKECRQAFDTLLTSLPSTTAVAKSVTDLSIPVPHGQMQLRVYSPDGLGPFPIIVYFHGGGWVIGSLDAYDNLCTELCARVGALVVSVEYRTAPEAKFPAATDDCLAALEWVASNATGLNGDSARIAVGGDSAGGNLAAVTALRARDTGGPSLRGQLLFYPVTKAAGEPTASLIANADGPLLMRADMEYFIEHYVRSEDDARHPYCSPLFATSFGDLPPALVQTAEFDPLCDEGEAYASAMREAGIDVVLTRYDGAFHGMLCFPTVLDQSRDMLAEAIAWLRVQLAE